MKKTQIEKPQKQQPIRYTLYSKINISLKSIDIIIGIAAALLVVSLIISVV